MKRVKNATIQFEIAGKTSTYKAWTPSPPSNTILTEEQLALIDVLIEERVSRTKNHFNTWGWNIWTSCDLQILHEQIFGCNWEDYVRARISESEGVAVRYGDDGIKFVNTAKRVYYNPHKNSLYTAYVIKDPDQDICVGLF